MLKYTVGSYGAVNAPLVINNNYVTDNFWLSLTRLPSDLAAYELWLC